MKYNNRKENRQSVKNSNAGYKILFNKKSVDRSAKLKSTLFEKM